MDGFWIVFGSSFANFLLGFIIIQEKQMNNNFENTLPNWTLKESTGKTIQN